MDKATLRLGEVTAVVLCGGRGQRMGGADKGLQPFRGMPLARWALQRIAPQVDGCLINANRNQEVYAQWGEPVLSDRSDLGAFAGPLAGVLTALEACPTPFLVTVPCDTPLFPPDLVARLGEAMATENADIALAIGLDEDGMLRPQPVFSLMRTSLAADLLRYLQSGSRKVDTWMERHTLARVAFDASGDDPHAFYNANTPTELQKLEALAAHALRSTR